MLKKKYRLPSRVRLEKVKTISARHFTLKTAKNNLSYPRFAFVISKKVDKRAVARNRIKRKMTNTLQDLMSKISGVDIIFILKKGAFENIEEVDKNMKEILTKEGF